LFHRFPLEKHQINLVTNADLSAYAPKESKAEITKNHRIYYGCLLVGHHPGDFSGSAP